jgi:hypothetical protein
VHDRAALVNVSVSTAAELSVYQGDRINLILVLYAVKQLDSSEIDQFNMSEEKKPFERLPTDVVPVNYKVELRPDLKAFTFQGKLEITVKVAN